MPAPIVNPTLAQLNNLWGFPPSSAFELGTYLNSIVASVGGVSTVDNIVAIGAQILFNLSATPAQPTAVLMSVNGQLQTYTADYTVAGAVLTFLATDFSLQTGDSVTVVYQT